MKHFLNKKTGRKRERELNFSLLLSRSLIMVIRIRAPSPIFPLGLVVNAISPTPVAKAHRDAAGIAKQD